MTISTIIRAPASESVCPAHQSVRFSVSVTLKPKPKTWVSVSVGKPSLESWNFYQGRKNLHYYVLYCCWHIPKMKLVSRSSKVLEELKKNFKALFRGQCICLGIKAGEDGLEWGKSLSRQTGSCYRSEDPYCRLSRGSEGCMVRAAID